MIRSRIFIRQEYPREIILGASYFTSNGISDCIRNIFFKPENPLCFGLVLIGYFKKVSNILIYTGKCVLILTNGL